MLKKSITFLFLCFCSTLIYAQTNYGFEWIRSYQAYYKFKVSENAVYRIDSALLANSGLNLSGLNPKRFQIFKNGVEQFVFVHGENDGVFNKSDFIEFYAEKNDGKADAELYRTPQEQPHTLSSLFTDTAVYFLTILPDTSVFFGKRLSSIAEYNYSSFTSEPYFTSEQSMTFTDFYYRGATLGASERYYISEYAGNEGWTNKLTGLNEFSQFAFQTPFKFATSELPSFETFVFGSSDYFLSNPNLPNHHIRISISADNGPFVSIKDTFYRGYTQIKQTSDFGISNIGNTQTILKLDVINDLAVGSDMNSLAYIIFKYPRQYKLASETLIKFNFKPKISASRSFISFDNFSGTSPVIYDLQNNKRYAGTGLSGKSNTLLDYSNQERTLLFFDSASIKTLSSLSAVNFDFIDPAQNYEFLIVSNKILSNAASQYFDYRSKRFKTLLVDADDLFNYYFYGNTHPLAIKRFCAHLINSAPNAPKYLLLLGRGYQNNLTRTSLDSYLKNLVPSIGEPASDNLYTYGLQSTNGVPAIPTGRIPAATNNEALNYLQKLIYTESSPDTIQAWRKNFLHLSGGADFQSEQIPFTNEVNYLKSLIVKKPLGANVISYHKNTTAPTQTNLKATLINHINQGVSMMTFLGHGSLTILDMDFGSINDLNNLNKYPFFYFNGCNIGNANDVDPGGTGQVYGKDYICAANKGAIGWLAHSNLTLTGSLFTQMNNLYLQLNGGLYGNSIGDIVKTALQNSVGANDEYGKSHALQLFLQGDPAMKIYSPALPDFKISDNDIFVIPENVTSKSDSLGLGIIISNNAKAIDDSIEISINHVFPDNSKIVLPKFKIRSPIYRDTIYSWIYDLGDKSTGNNKFEVGINNSQEIIESNYSNNNASTGLLIPGNGIQVLFPQLYSIINTDSAELLVQHNDLFAKNQEYIFEIDTSIYFNASNPFYKNSGIIKSSNLGRFKFKLDAGDSMVYYWRARLNLSPEQGGLWVYSNFTFMKDEESGYRQSKYYQVKNITASDKIVFDSSQGTINFAVDERVITINNRRWNHSNMGIFNPYIINAGVGACIAEGVVAIVFNPLQVDIPVELQNYPFNCTYVQQNKSDISVRYYPFDTRVQNQRDEFRKFIDSIPDGFYVAIFSRYSSDVPNWDASTKNSLSKIGSYKIAQIQSPNTCWGIIGRKGESIGMAYEDTLNNDALSGQPYPNQNDTSRLNITRIVKSRWFTGSFISAPFGPASEWKSLKYDFVNIDNQPSGSKRIDVIGVNQNGVDTLLFYNASSNLSLASVDAKKYPFIKLRATFTDSLNRTPDQFGYWQLSSLPVAEAALSAEPVYEFYSDKLNQGDSVKIKISIVNLSNINYDSATISFSITDADRVRKISESAKTKVLSQAEFLVVEKQFSTAWLSGKNTFSVELNVDRKVPELSLNNNYFNKIFEVTADKVNPFLEVTIDGQKIMNGDIVSPNPVIRITSKDDNKFKLQNDTATFVLYFRKPSQFDFEKVLMTDADVQFIPADNNSNKAELIFSPKKLNDGIYTIRIQAFDASGNAAGGNFYEIDFNVINKSSITRFYPYPNPFTTSMRFVFTLTGEKTPDDLLIRIMTVSGKIVREISKREFGPIRIGNNISEFAWDGTDSYGNRLANGVYLYQVFSKIEGKDIENRKTRSLDEDKFFKENSGKIFMMR